VVAFKPFRYWQAAAAAAVVLIITSVWLFSLNKNAVLEQKTATVIAKTEEVPLPQQQPAPSLADSEKTGVDKDSINTSKVATNTHHWYNENKVVTEKPKAPAPKAQAPYKYSNSTTEKAPVTAANPQLNDASANFAQPEKKEAMARKNTEPAAAAAPPDAMAKALRIAEEKAKEDREAETELITIARNDIKARKAAAKDKNLSGFIKGQVTDPFNNPVANAYVQVQLQKATNNHLLNNLTTDKWGYFKIPVSDSVVDVAVNVSGYGTQNFTLQNNAALNQLQLQPANYSSDHYSPTAPVNNKKQLANSYKFPNVMLYDAEPAYGWIAFGQYLEKNKIIPAGAENVTGNVIVSFEVNKKGALSEYKIEQSLSKAHDEEAIRLIKQGPSWKLRNGRKARITVMVKF